MHGYGTVYEVMVDGVSRIAKQLHSVLIALDVRRDEKRGIYARLYKECLLLSELDHSNTVLSSLLVSILARL